VKKVIFALLGAVAMAFIPLNVSAADRSCEITVSSGSKTINYDLNDAYGSNNCHVHVERGATLIVENGGKIYADSDYAIKNKGGIVIVRDSLTSVRSALHPAIWSNGGTVQVYGGTLSSAGGHEENITFTQSGTLTNCGNYSYDTINGAQVNVDNSTCPASKPAPAPTPAAEPKPAEPTKSSSEKITITIISREKTEQKTTSAPAPQVTQKTETVAETPVETKEEAKEEIKTETPSKAEAEEKAETAAKEEKLPEAGQADSDNSIAIIIAATIAALGTASTAVFVNRLRA